MSIFDTQANTFNNSFGNPLNPANVNAGWGINSSLLTPSYMSRYRPQYAGGQAPIEYERRSFSRGVANLFGPGDYPYYANPVDHQQEDIDAVSQRPVDSAAWALQRVIAPAMVFGGTFKVMGPGGSGMDFVRGTLAGRGIGPGWGSKIFRGAAGGFARGLGFSAETAGAISGGSSLLGAGVGAIGGIVGGVVAPIVAGTMGMKALESGFFDPYIQQRQQSTNLLNNFRGINFSDASGNVVTGGGLGRREAAGMANQLTKAGLKDLMFTSEQFTQISDMTARSGLLDTVNSKGIVDKIKGVTEQIKLIMDITKDPDFKNAIEELAKLEKSGASAAGGLHSDATMAMRRINQYANMAGISAKRMMETVGAQGEYLFQANGMTPYLGQIAAANAMASFSIAKRQGLMSPAQLARLGGAEGATQSLLTGQINASQTMFNQMGLANTYLFGGKEGDNNSMSGRGGPASIITHFSQNFVKDPVGNYGLMHVFSGEMASLQMQKRGSLSLDDQIYNIAKSANLLDKNGEVTGARAAGIMASYLHMPTDQIQAYLHNKVNNQDPEVMKAKMAGLKRDEAERTRAGIDRDALHTGVYGFLDSSVRRWERGALAKMSTAPGWVTDMVGSLGDKLQGAADWLGYSGTLGTSGDDKEMFSSPERTKRIKKQREEEINLIRTKGVGALEFSPNARGVMHTFSDFKDSLVGNWTSEDSRLTAERINKMAKDHDTDARGYLAAKTPEERAKFLNNILHKKPGEGFSPEMASALSSSDGGFENQKRFESDIYNVTQKGGREKWKETDTDSFMSTGFEKAATVVKNVITNGKSGGHVDGAPSTLSNRISTDVGPYDTIKAVGEARELVSMEASGKIKSEADLVKLISTDPRFAETKRQYIGKDGQPTVDLAKQLRSTLDSGVREAFVRISSIAQKIGSVDQVQANPNLILDKDLRKKFMDPKATLKDKEKILALYARKVNDNSSLDPEPGLKPEKLSDSDLTKLTDNLASGTDSRFKAYEQANKDKIDASDVKGYFSAMSDFAEGVTSFGKEVGKFGEHVKEIGNLVKTPAKPVPDSTPHTKSWFSGLNPFSAGDDFVNNQQNPLGHK